MPYYFPALAKSGPRRAIRGSKWRRGVLTQTRFRGRITQNINPDPHTWRLPPLLSNGKEYTHGERIESVGVLRPAYYFACRARR